MKERKRKKRVKWMDGWSERKKREDEVKGMDDKVIFHFV